MIIAPDENGISDYDNEGYYILSYFTDTNTLHEVRGVGKCRITGMSLTIEYFDTEELRSTRMNNLNIIIPEEEE